MMEAATALNMPQEQEIIDLKYEAISPTLVAFHNSTAPCRAIIGEFGSGKTTAAGLEVGYFLPRDMWKWYGIKRTRWAVVRNIYRELIDNVLEPLQYWFPWGTWNSSSSTFTIKHTLIEAGGQAVELEVELLLRACDIPKHIKKFKSLNLTGAWIDESSEISDSTRTIVMGRCGRFPHHYKEAETGEMKPCPVSFFIETSNPPDIEQALYTDYKWMNRQPPGPVTKIQPKNGYEGFWQYPGENKRNLKPGYYDGLRENFKNQPDMLARYLEGKPGVLLAGKLVYANFKPDYHVAKEPLVWSGGVLYRGWDNTGNQPAVIVAYIPTPGSLHVLAEYYTERDGIVDFARKVVESCNQRFLNATYIEYADPAGANKFSHPKGGLTSNQELLESVLGQGTVIPSENNFRARVTAVDSQLARIDGILIDPGCTRLINGFMGGYHYPKVQSGGNEEIYSEEPLKNKYSHPHDALQYVCVKLFNNKVERPKPKASDAHRPPLCGIPSGSGWMGR